ncbi:uncharacterized protein LOC110031949 isoform X2 [Phalaenopsis equestris]|uniref:uncharacterized protein LOC110031949 isoform X2 n=1 Tax=Phalaenopsis equestris TaxID=78828 RepID=UPI0009E2E1B5|nr:uncharacterized protein LOC110031949 isoform X2 [Phalaenopsis equestris]
MSQLIQPFSLLERMASLRPANPSKSVERRLYEFLEKPQEPFLMDVYLFENGCSDRIIRSHSSPYCWPLNAAGKRLQKFGYHEGLRRRSAAGCLTRAWVKLFYSKAIRKVLHLDRMSTAKKHSSIFDFFSVELKDQLSPVSVLELQHSDESSPLDKQNECPLTLRMDSPRESPRIHVKSPFYQKAKFSDRRRFRLDFLTEAEERNWSFHGCLDSNMFADAMNEPRLSWRCENGEVANLTQTIASESSRFRAKFIQLKPEAWEIGLFLEETILDDLKEAAILDMLNSNFH